MRFFRALAWMYAAVTIAALIWALITDVSMRHSGTEHMLPDLVVFLIGAPLSSGAIWLLELLPDRLALSGWVQYSLFGLCPVAQAAGLLWLTRSERSKNAPA